MTDKLVSDLVTALGLAASIAGTDIALVSQDGGATLRPTLIDTLKTYMGAGITDALTFDDKAAFSSSGLSFSGINYVLVRNVSGVPGGDMLWYKRGTSTPTGLYGEVSRGGVYWAPLYSTNPVRVGEWGYKPDWNGSTGTDNQPIVQASLDWASANNWPLVAVNPGPALFDDTVHVGRGDSYKTLRLVGLGGASFDGNLAGVAWYPSKTDRPAINIQGGRESWIKGIFLYGKNYTWITTNRVGLAGGLNSLSSTLSDWVDPALRTTPGGVSQHTPYAAITVDAFKGSTPANPYKTGPDLGGGTYASATYGKLASSAVVIDGCGAYGFPVGIVGSPNATNGDGSSISNGDFIRFRDNDFNYCAIPIGLGNTQARGNEISYCNVNSCHTVIDTVTFGQGSSLLGGTIHNLETTTVYQIFNTTVGAINGTSAKSIYCEVGVKLGTFGLTSGAVVGSINIEGLQFDTAEELHGSIPDAFVVHPPGCTVKLINPVNKLGSRIQLLSAGGGDLIIETGCFQGNLDRMLGTTFGNAANRRAVNHSGGLMCPLHDPIAPIPSGWQAAIEWRGNTNARYLTSPTQASTEAQYLGRKMVWKANRQQMTQAVQELPVNYNGNANGTYRLLHRENNLLLDMSAVGPTNVYPVGPVLSGETLTFTVNGGQQTDSLKFAPGDFVTNPLARAMFVVQSVTASGSNFVVTALQMNNMEVDPSTYEFVSNHVTTADLTANPTWILTRCGPLLPWTMFYGTFMSGSTAVTDIHPGDGTGDALSTYVATGDGLVGFPFATAGVSANDAWPIRGGAPTSITVTNGSGGPGSAVLGTTALVAGRFPLYPLPVAR